MNRKLHAILRIESDRRLFIVNAYLQPCVEVKSRGQLMLARAAEIILNQPESVALIKADRAAMRHRLIETTITIVFSNDVIKFAVRFPFNHAWVRFVAHHKRSLFVSRVLLNGVDLNR